MLTHYARLCYHVYWPDPARVEKEFREAVLDRVSSFHGSIQAIAIRDFERGTERFCVFTVVETIDSSPTAAPVDKEDDDDDRENPQHHSSNNNNSQNEGWVHVSAPVTQFICIRGTINLHNLLVDLNIATAADQDIHVVDEVAHQDKSNEVRFHRGWLRMARLMVNDLLSPDALVRLDKNLPTVLIGHSLGGAVAIILALHLRSEGFNIAEVVTFGQPRIAPEQSCDILKNFFEENADSSLTMASLLRRHPASSFSSSSSPNNSDDEEGNRVHARKLIPLLRVINECDPVPVLPPLRFYTYSQFGPQMTLLSKTSTTDHHAASGSQPDDLLRVQSTENNTQHDGFPIVNTRDVPHNAEARASLLEKYFRRARHAQQQTTDTTTDTTTMSSLISIQSLAHSPEEIGTIPAAAATAMISESSVEQTTTTTTTTTMGIWSDAAWWISWILGREHHIDVYVSRLKTLASKCDSDTGNTTE